MAKSKKSENQEVTKNVNNAEEKVAPVQQPEPKFELAKLQEHCAELFGVSTSTFVGATNGLPETENYSVSEVEKIIEEWKRQEVK